MRIRIVLVSFWIATICSSASAAAPLADQLPSETVLYVGWAGRSLAFDGSAMGQCLKEPAVSLFMEAVQEAIAGDVTASGLRQAIKNGSELARIAWQHPAAIALTEVRLPKRWALPGSAVMVVDLGQDRQASEVYVNAMLKGLGESVPLSERTEEGVTYKILTLGEKATLCIGFKGNLLFAAVGDGMAKELIFLEPAKSLATNKKFVEARLDVEGEDEQISFFLDVPLLTQQLGQLRLDSGGGRTAAEPAMNERFQRLIDALGAAKATAAAGSVRIVDHGMYTKVRLLSSPPYRGLLLPFGGPALSDQDLNDLPDDADLVAAMKLSPETAYAELRHVLRQIDPELETDLLRTIGQAEQELGISIAEDILGNLGDNWTLCSAPSQGGFLTGTVLTVGIKDSRTVTAAMRKIEEHQRKQTEPTTGPTTRQAEQAQSTRPQLPDRRGGLKLSVQTIKAGRTEIQYLCLPRGAPLRLAPAWAVHKDKLYLAGWPQVIESAIDNVGRRSKPLIQDPDFRKLRARFDSRASALLYVNWPKILRQSYSRRLVGAMIDRRTLASKMGLEAIPAWPMALSKLETYTWPEITAISADKQGVVLEAYGSQPSSLIVVPALAHVVMPAFFSARAEARKVRASANLKAIVKAIAMYVEDSASGGDYPPDLASLVGRQAITPADLVSPASGRKPPEFADGRLVGEIDYIYIQPPPDAGPAERLITVYERPENYHGKGTWVAFADCHVEWLDMDSFRQALRLTQEHLWKPPDKKELRADDF